VVKRKRARILVLGLHPAHSKKALSANPMILDSSKQRESMGLRMLHLCMPTAGSGVIAVF
jgi:hypothetical protein